MQQKENIHVYYSNVCERVPITDRLKLGTWVKDWSLLSEGVLVFTAVGDVTCLAYVHSALCIGGISAASLP